MAIINQATKELQVKIVYYGPGLCGKTNRTCSGAGRTDAEQQIAASRVQDMEGLSLLRTILRTKFLLNRGKYRENREFGV